ncbi:MAG: FG-GAP-like repeat-containing protein [Bacteroidota bacterium]
MENIRELIIGGFLLVLLVTLKAHSQSFSYVESFESQSILTNTNGVAVADYDLDGDLDIFLVASRIFNEDDPLSWSRLLRNADGSFEDVTIDADLYYVQEEPRPGSQGSKMGASWGDYDNDGYPDLYLTVYGYNQLWRNRGDGTFENVTEDKDVAGCFACYSANALWWDYDLDGDLDLYVSNWIKENVLYKNLGEGAFEDISISSRLNDVGLTWAALPMDVDEDGLPDLYVINDVGENNFFKNLGDDTFEEMTDEVGLFDEGDGMGVDVGDYNQDGHFDIYLTNIYDFHPNPFFVNNGDGTFTDRAVQLDIDDTGWGWGVRFFDAEHDMDEDLFVVNGMDSPFGEGDRNTFFLNNNGVFNDASQALGLDDPKLAIGLETLDYDMDGDLDMIIGNRETYSQLVENNTVEIGDQSNWIQIWLEGTASNKDALGSAVRIFCNGKNYYRHHSGVNLLGQSLKPVHFGLSDHQSIDLIEVTWPNSNREFVEDIEANQVIRLVEGTLTPFETVTAVDANFKSALIYPNPFDGSIYVNTADEVNFSLYALSGQLIIEKDLLPRGGHNQINTRHLKPGTYLYHLTGKNGQQQGVLLRR